MLYFLPPSLSLAHLVLNCFHLYKYIFKRIILKKMRITLGVNWRSSVANVRSSHATSLQYVLTCVIVYILTLAAKNDRLRCAVKNCSVKIMHKSARNAHARVLYVLWEDSPKYSVKSLVYSCIHHCRLVSIAPHLYPRPLIFF